MTLDLRLAGALFGHTDLRPTALSFRRSTVSRATGSARSSRRPVPAGLRRQSRGELLGAPERSASRSGF